MVYEPILNAVKNIQNEISKNFNNPVLMDIYDRTTHDIATGEGLSDPGFGKNGTMTLYENILVKKGFFGLGKTYNKRMLCSIESKQEGDTLPVLIISDVKDKVQESIERNLKNYKLEITVQDREN
jgi:hypothetical protein